MAEAQAHTDIPLRTVARELDGGESFEMDRTRPIKIIIVNFDPELNHPQHAEVWTPLKEVVEAALGIPERQAREDVWLHFDHTTTVDSIKKAVEGVKRVEEKFSGDIIGIVSSGNCNRLAFFHGEQSNSFKPITDTFRKLPGGEIVAIVTQDYVKDGAEMMWRSAEVTLGMEMQVQSSAMNGDRGLVLSWHKHPYTVHGRALAAFVLRMSRGPEDQVFPLPPLPATISTCLDMGAAPILSIAHARHSPDSTDEEGDVGDRSHLLRNQANHGPESGLPGRVFIGVFNIVARAIRSFLQSSPEQQKKSIWNGLQNGLLLVTCVIVPVIFRHTSSWYLISYISCRIWRLSPTRARSLQLISHHWRRLAPCQQTRFHLIYRTDTFNREVKPQVDQFVNSCLAGNIARTSAGVAPNVEWPIKKAPHLSREILQSWVSDPEGFRNVAVLFTAADAYYENPSQLDDDISVLLGSGFKHCIICAMFDAGFLDDHEDTDRIRSARLERQVAVPEGPVSLVSWYSRPASAIARELLQTGVVPSRGN